MKKITVQFTFEELKAVLELVDNQLFRMKYIDPKIPGHLPNPEKERAASSGVQSLQVAFRIAKGFKAKATV